MELNLNISEEDSHSKKHNFSLKTDRNDGLLLQIHHSYSDSRGESKVYRFIYGSFNEPGSHLALADHKGHIFIINLETEKYWQLPDLGLPTVISFLITRKYELLVGLDTTSILIVNIETGTVKGVLNGHSSPATEISYSDNGRNYLTSNSTEAIIWDSSTNSQIHRLSLKSEVALKKVLFMPMTNQILACFKDNTMHIWKFGTFECLKQIIPETWKTHHVKTVALTKNGRALVIAGRSPSLVIFCLDTWLIMKVVEFPEFIPGIKQMEFVPQVFDGGANKILAFLTTSLEFYFFDIEKSTFLKGLHQIFGMTVKFILSSNGKYIACFLTTGEVNIYLIEKILSSKQLRSLGENEGVVGNTSNNNNNNNNNNNITSANFSSNSKRTQKSLESLISIKKELQDVLDRKKLIPILKQFGEYPESYRLIIWKTILQLPGNQDSYVSLSSKKCYTSYSKLESKYSLVNKSLCNSLKKLLSNLSYWCPLFGEVEFMPEFVFPFVKLFHSDPLACFETVATILVNWCQNWFEFYPFPPINMLFAMENILGHHDPDLLEFYLKNNITSSVTVCPLFHTAFSEVLSRNEWLKLWDHVLSNEPSFLFMAIIAYNIICRNAIKTFTHPEELEKFFHKQNPIDMKMLITKTYYFLKETPEEIHSRQFFSRFRPLNTGGIYTSFVAYPKLIMDPNAQKLQVIRKEEEELMEEQLKALNLKNKLDKKLEKENNTDQKEKIYMELEEKMRKLVEDEEDRILIQRQKLQNLRHELRIKELEVLEDARNKALKERIKKKELEFERLLKDVSKRKAREKLEVDVIEEEIKKYYSELLLRKCQLELELGAKDEEDNIGASLDIHRKKFQNDLLALQNEWGTLHHSKSIELSNKMAAIRALIHDLQTDVAKEITEKECEKQSQQNRVFVNQLKRKVRNLEDEVEKLLIDNLNQLQREQKEKKPLADSPFQSKFLSSSRREKSPQQTLRDSTLPKCVAKNISKSKPRESVRTISQSVSPGVRKITTIRTKVHKNKLQGDKFIYSVKPARSTHSNKYSDFTKPSTRPKILHFKSKFTCPTEFKEFASDSPGDCGENLINYNKSSESEVYFAAKKLHQPKGDFSSKEKLTSDSKLQKSKRRGNISKFTILKNTSTEKTESEEEIIKSAFRARQQIIDKAKIRHMVE